MTEVLNYAEAGLWFAVGLGLFLAAGRLPRAKARLAAISAAAFLLFGFSDLIESQTQGWWDPLWLLFLKAGCIAALLFCFWRYRIMQRTAKEQKTCSQEQALP